MQPRFKSKDICISVIHNDVKNMWIYYIVGCEQSRYIVLHNKLPSSGRTIMYGSPVEDFSKLIKENATEEEFKNIVEHYKENSIFI